MQNAAPKYQKKGDVQWRDFIGEKKSYPQGTMLKNITISASDTIHCDENAKGSLNLGMRKNNATQESPEVISILKIVLYGLTNKGLIECNIALFAGVTPEKCASTRGGLFVPCSERRILRHWENPFSQRRFVSFLSIRK